MMTKIPETAELLAMLRKGTEHLVAMAKGLEFPWEPDLADPRKLHNMFARNLITAYVSKFADLSQGLIMAVEQQNFMLYALCGRALIENTALLRYYLTEKYQPLLKPGALTTIQMKQLIEIDDQHLRGGKFDWDSFFFQNYSKLTSEVTTRLDHKKKKKKIPPSTQLNPKQVSIGECVDSWAAASPGVGLIYNLFCDLVHPNIGSTFLVASTTPGSLVFSRFRGDPVGSDIVKQSLPILLATTHKPFGDYLAALMTTIWQDDELEQSG